MKTVLCACSPYTVLGGVSRVGYMFVGVRQVLVMPVVGVIGRCNGRCNAGYTGKEAGVVLT